MLREKEKEQCRDGSTRGVIVALPLIVNAESDAAVAKESAWLFQCRLRGNSIWSENYERKTEAGFSMLKDSGRWQDVYIAAKDAVGIVRGANSP